jgi:Integrase core domain
MVRVYNAAMKGQSTKRARSLSVPALMRSLSPACAIIEQRWSGLTCPRDRSRAEAKIIIAAWRRHYNEVRAHSSEASAAGMIATDHSYGETTMLTLRRSRSAPRMPFAFPRHEQHHVGGRGLADAAGRHLLIARFLIARM